MFLVMRLTRPTIKPLLQVTCEEQDLPGKLCTPTYRQLHSFKHTYSSILCLMNFLTEGFFDVGDRQSPCLGLSKALAKPLPKPSTMSHCLIFLLKCMYLIVKVANRILSNLCCKLLSTTKSSSFRYSAYLSLFRKYFMNCSLIE